MGVAGAVQSALDPHGPEASAIAQLAWAMFAGGTVIFVLVAAAALLAVHAPRPWLANRALVVGGGIVLPVAILSALLAYTLAAAPRLALAGAPDVSIEVVARQWWWQVRYLDRDGRVDFATANEIRIPAGRVVEVRLRSADVLHSFWVPALGGKLDAIPGRENRVRLAADRAGTFRGQCAEYCGGPHGQMALHVVAEEPDRFEAWRAAQRQPAQARAAAQAAPGEASFLAHCAGCHTVRGTAAEGVLGPDLTHVAARAWLGAGLIPNDAPHREDFISAGQRLKRGNLMPEFGHLPREELRAIAAYLGTLR